MAKSPAGSAIVIGTAAAASAVVVYAFAVRARMLRWGATDGELQRRLPGDDLVPNPKLNATHAVTVRAPVTHVWQWLVQMGQGRGGFYSYDAIENLMGLGIHSADRILPEFQNLQVGDKIPLAPGGFGVPVAILQPCRALVVNGDTRLDAATIPTMAPGDYFSVSWGWFLDEVTPRTTRLIERWRADWNPSLQNAVFMRGFLEPGAFLMERKMLLGIKARAERAFRMRSSM